MQRLSVAELQFKLALGVNLHRAFSRGDSAFPYLDTFSYGKHVASRDELALSPSEERDASLALEHTTTYVMALQIDTALEALVPERFTPTDTEAQNASWIARLIRNAFAHAPQHPRWLTYPGCDTNHFSVREIIALDTNGLNGQPVDYKHFGGPLALLRFSVFVRTDLIPRVTANTVAQSDTVRPAPGAPTHSAPGHER
jgi:hypothetical protein